MQKAVLFLTQMANKIYVRIRFRQRCITFSCKSGENYIATSAYNVKSNEKKIVKALDKARRDFVFLKQKFLCVSESKLTADYFNGPQIRELLNDPNQN